MLPESEPVAAFHQKVSEGIPDEFRIPLDIHVSAECETVLKDPSLLFPLLELVNNCAEKNAEGITVLVQIRRDGHEYILTVEDSVRYNPEDAVRIASTLNSPNPGRSGKRRKELRPGDESAGMGIAISRKYFEKRGGKLEYRKSDDNRIIAEARWGANP